MVTEILLKEFVAALFKNSVIQKHTDPIIEKGIEKLRGLFQKKGKEKLLDTLTNSAETPQLLAEQQAEGLDELLKDNEFRETVRQLAAAPTVYASVVGVPVSVAKDISLKLTTKDAHGADIAGSVVNSSFESREGGFSLEINS